MTSSVFCSLFSLACSCLDSLASFLAALLLMVGRCGCGAVAVSGRILLSAEVSEVAVGVQADSVSVSL